MLPSRMFLSKDVTFTAFHFDYIDIPFAEGKVVTGGTVISCRSGVVYDRRL